MHLHLREGDMLKLVAPLTSKKISGALIMTNLLPITTKEALLSYKQKIKDNCCKTLSLWSHDKFPN